MKVNISPRRLFLLGFVVVILTNIFLFSGVAINRMGQPDSELTLTERELGLPYSSYRGNSKENSGLSLRLIWRVLGREDSHGYSYSGSPVWLDGEKLKSLGFKPGDVDGSTWNRNNYKQPLGKEVYIVLELGGQPYQEHLKRQKDEWLMHDDLLQADPDNQQLRENVKNAEQRFHRERIRSTRLFAIDVGLDPEQLRLKYAARDRFVIARGLIDLQYDYQEKVAYGHLSNLSIENIHVPLQHQEILDRIIADKIDDSRQYNDPTPPRFEVEIAYGSRLEPWIVAVRPLDDD